MKTVFLDIDTQQDFVSPAGALYAPGAEKLIPIWVRLKEHALNNGIPLISTMDAHSEDDPEFHDWPPHCVVGTLGQRKPEKLAPHSTALLQPFRCPFQEIRDRPHQVLLEKASIDCFENTHLPKVLEHLEADRFVVYGVVTEVCVNLAVRGLLRYGKKIELLQDAVQAFNHQKADEILREFQAAGVGISTAFA